jgi:hypothetical protein
MPYNPRKHLEQKDIAEAEKVITQLDDSKNTGQTPEYLNNQGITPKTGDVMELDETLLKYSSEQHDAHYEGSDDKREKSFESAKSKLTKYIEEEKLKARIEEIISAKQFVTNEFYKAAMLDRITQFEKQIAELRGESNGR